MLSETAHVDRVTAIILSNSKSHINNTNVAVALLFFSLSLLSHTHTRCMCWQIRSHNGYNLEIMLNTANNVNMQCQGKSPITMQFDIKQQQKKLMRR